MKFEKIEILKDFVNYCIDINKDTKNKKTKELYVKNFILYIYEFKQIKTNEIEKVRKEVENILKYNALTIEKLKQDKIKDLQNLPF